MPLPSLYADLSQYYDLLCSAIDYKEQCDFALRAHQLLGNGGHRYLDLACGSGAHLAHVHAAGFSCAGLDISDAMLALAAQRCPQAQLHSLDMSDLKSVNEFDLITCFLYSIHYSYPRAKLEQTLQRVYQSLTAGGLFCFDAVDKNSVANDAGHAHQVTFGQQTLRFQTRWFYSGHGKTLDLHISIREQQRHYNEQHVMTAVTVPELRDTLQSIGFAVMIFERDFDRLLPWQGENGNVMICGWKEA